MIKRIIIALLLLTQSTFADCTYSATADVINDKLVNKKEKYICNFEYTSKFNTFLHPTLHFMFFLCAFFHHLLK